MTDIWATTSRHATQTDLRRQKRLVVLDYVRWHGVTTATDISKATDLNAATVMRVINDLTEEGFLAHDGFLESGGGRPRAKIRFEGQRHAIIGIEASKNGFHGAITDLDGHIQAELSVPAVADGPGNLDQLITLIEVLMAVDRPKEQDIVGIGVGVPSIVRQPEGVVEKTLGLDWNELPLRAQLQDRFGIDVIVENDRNLAAMGEFGFGSGRRAQSVISLAIGPGAGAGIVVDGKLLRGRSNASGELSWFLDDPALTGRAFDRLGDKNQLRFSGVPEAVVHHLAQLAVAYEAGTLKLADIEAADSAGPLGAVKDLLDFSTMGVSSLIAVLNPQIVVLNGGLVRGGQLVLDVLDQRLAGNVYDMPEIVMTTLGSRDIVLGAIQAVLDCTVLNPPL